MTKTQIQKLNDLRQAADAHGDDKTVSLVDSALSGDAAAAATLGIAAKAHRAVSTGAAARAARAPRRQITARADHPWSQDVE